MLGIKSLRSKKFRQSMDIFFVEGEKFVDEIPEKYEVLQYVISDKFKKPTLKYARRAKILTANESVFARVAETSTPQGIIAVVKKIEYNVQDFLEEKGFILILENVSDPANVGGLIRTAAAANAGGVILTEGSASAWSPKVLRASAGCCLKIKVANTQINTAISQIKSKNIPVYAAHPTGNMTPYEIDLCNRFALIIGSEARGISQTVKKQADRLVRLPMNAKVESLSASTAGAVLMYESVRQKTCNCHKVP